jgi:hypothetical protein
VATKRIHIDRRRLTWGILLWCLPMSVATGFLLAWFDIDVVVGSVVVAVVVALMVAPLLIFAASVVEENER